MIKLFFPAYALDREAVFRSVCENTSLDSRELDESRSLAEELYRNRRHIVFDERHLTRDIINATPTGEMRLTMPFGNGYRGITAALTGSDVPWDLLSWLDHASDIVSLSFYRPNGITGKNILSKADRMPLIDAETLDAVLKEHAQANASAERQSLLDRLGALQYLQHPLSQHCDMAFA